jgi:hypothetical protein
MFNITNFEKIYSGNYDYYQEEKRYCQESFEVYTNRNDKSMLYKSDLLSRVSSGEFLKIRTLYEINENHLPVRVLVDKKMGKNNVQEFFEYDFRESKLIYKFITDKGAKVQEKPISSRFLISTPSFLTTALFAYHRKFDNAPRSPFLVVKSSNIWEAKYSLTEEHIYVKFHIRDHHTIEILNQTFEVIECEIFNTDSWDGGKQDETPLRLTIIPDHAIPFSAVFDDGVEIETTNFRRMALVDGLEKL